MNHVASQNNLYTTSTVDPPPICFGPAIRECEAPHNDCGSLRGPNGRQDLTCVDGQCRCAGIDFYDYCTCLRKKIY